MLGWIKRRAAKQSLFNVQINARTLLVVANRADAAIQANRVPNAAHVKQVVAAQERLLTDIQLALEHGADLEDVKSSVEDAKAKEGCTDGAQLAIAHVLSCAEA